MTENCHFQLFFAFSSLFLEIEMGCYYLRFYTAESRHAGGHLLEFSRIFLYSHTGLQAHETGKNCLFGRFLKFLLSFLMPKMK